MKKYCTFNRFSLRAAFGLAAILALTAATFAQVKLRDALDFDGDDKADYSVYRITDNTWYIFNSSGTYTYRQFGLFDYDTVAPGDYDGDGKADFAVWRYTDRVWYVLNSSTGTVSYTQFGLIGDEPVARDYDGDGKTDIATIRRTNGQMIWHVLGSRDGYFTLTFGLSTDSPAPGDYDGDGKFDAAVFRQGASVGAQSYYWIHRSGDGGASAFPWGIYGDVVVPGDYDGDGKTDAAIMRRGATNQQWYVLRSSDMQYMAVSFGLTETDFPAQNDYDGDGKTDFALWRETDGNFYILKSSDSNLGVVPWGWFSDTPIAGYDAH